MIKPVTVTLHEPVQFGSELVSELVLRPLARAFKDVKMGIPTSGSGSLEYEPYALAAVGCRMAGRPDAFVNQLSIPDMNEIAAVVLSFFEPPPKTGISPSQS
jgi:hypothetical protein